MTLTDRCPSANPEQQDWTQAQSSSYGSCRQCSRITWLRTEPFSSDGMCKKDWEYIVYGEED